jgi:hypothetical protein
MTRAARGRPGRQIGPLKEKTQHALATKARIHAIVGQVIDELEKRRAKGKGDYVAKLADEIEKGGLSAWKALSDLLPREMGPAGNGGSSNFASLFVTVMQRRADEERRAAAAALAAPSEIIDVQAIELEPARPAEVQTDTNMENSGHVEW